MFCPNCGHPADEGNRFCSICGTKLPTPDQIILQHETDEPAIAPDEIMPDCAPTPEAAPEPSNEPAVLEYYPPIPPASAPEQEKPRKGTRWIPALILLAMFSIGLTVFLISTAIDAQNTTPWLSVRFGELSFDWYAYEGDSTLTIPEIVNNQEVIMIGDGCFKGCADLETVILPDSVTHIGKRAFADCTKLRGIFLPEGTAQIDSRAFENCTALEAICIPKSAGSVARDAFSGCSKLHFVFFTGTTAQWRELYPYGFESNVQIYCSDGII